MVFVNQFRGMHGRLGRNRKYVLLSFGACLGGSVIVFLLMRNNLLLEFSQDGNARAVSWLLTMGADPAAKSDDRSAVSLAIEKGNADVVRTLLDHGVPTGLNLVMIEGASESHPDLVELMLSRGASPNYQAPDGETAIICAVKNGDERSVKVLLRHGANPMLRDETGRSALDYAKLLQEPSITKLLRQPSTKGNDAHRDR